jgi:hypothetical protein
MMRSHVVCQCAPEEREPVAVCDVESAREVRECKHRGLDIGIDWLVSETHILY